MVGSLPQMFDGFCAGIVAANDQDQMPFDPCWACDATGEVQGGAVAAVILA